MKDESGVKPDGLSPAEGEATTDAAAFPAWQRDLLKGLLWALLILVSLLFYSGDASHFIYVDF